MDGGEASIAGNLEYLRDSEEVECGPACLEDQGVGRDEERIH